MSSVYCKTCNISYSENEWKKFPVSYGPSGRFEDKSVKCPKCGQWICLHGGYMIMNPQKRKFMDFKVKVKL